LGKLGLLTKNCGLQVATVGSNRSRFILPIQLVLPECDELLPEGLLPFRVFLLGLYCISPVLRKLILQSISCRAFFFDAIGLMSVAAQGLRDELTKLWTSASSTLKRIEFL
jgi:hypothetical protein